MSLISKFLVLATTASIFVSCGAPEKEKSSLQPGERKETGENKVDVAKKLKSELKKLNELPNYTIIMMPKGDVQASIEKLLEGKGKLLYDPNKRVSSSIPFYIAELTPDQINDEKFIGSLKLKIASFDTPETAAQPVEADEQILTRDLTRNIPTDSVGITQLGDPRTLGEGITVAVMDTGVDASHPALRDRMVYWYDGGETTRTELKKVKVAEDSIQLEEGDKKVKVELPKALKGSEEVYMAIMDETKYTGQTARIGQKKEAFLDFNGNNSADKFVVIVKKDETGHEIYIDVNGDKKFVTAEENRKKVDFNSTTKENLTDGMVKFPSRNNIIEYPVLLSEEGESMFIEIGLNRGDHGTHVAGIMAANDPENGLLGAAPKADIMGIRVCGGQGCTSSAILKGFVKAFYNGKVIPDVVNVSLGSLEENNRELVSHFFNDLVAKFGTAIFISASNSGPGFRTLNHFGNSGPLIMVGANVSKNTYEDQYNLPDGAQFANETMLHFSSLGPSYTGEMKPNIVAPGAAIAPITAQTGYMSHMNGTSMSSPMAAGAFAAVLGKVKSKNPELFKKIAEVRKANLETEEGAKETLMPYAYAMRDSLQNGAVALKDISSAQQGYGLIQVGPTEKLLTDYLTELTEGSRDYFEVVLNDYKPAYDRTLDTKKIQKFKLSVGFDGERSKESLAKIYSQGVDVELKQVEVLNMQGEVKILTGNKMFKYFSLIQRGNESADVATTKIAFNNGRAQDFISRRKLEKMDEGKTYIARYQVSQNGAIQTDILDVVHRPIELKKVAMNAPNLNVNIQELEAGFVKTGQVVKTSHYHRYPIAVTKDMVSITAVVTVDSDDTGVIYANLNRPDGTEVGLAVAIRSDIFPDETKAAVVTAKVPQDKLENGKPFEGIWELTVSAGSSNGPKNTKYDVGVSATKFGLKKEDYLGKAGEMKIIPVQTKTVEIGKVELKAVMKVAPVEIDIKAGYTSFHPLPIAKDYKGIVALGMNPTKPDFTDYVWGAPEPALYVKNEKGEFTQFKAVKPVGPGAWMIAEPAGKEVYMGFFTYRNFFESEAGVKSGNKVHMLVKTPIQDKETLSKISVGFENFTETETGVIKVDLTESKLTGIEVNGSVTAKGAPMSQNFSVLVLE